MQLVILATGKCRDKHMLALEKDYLGRLPAHWRVAVRELADGATPQEEAAVQRAALASLNGPVMKVMLDERGELLDSRGLAAKVGAWQGQGAKTMAVLIGGAAGLAPELRAEADLLLGFGRLTFPHQLVRVLVAEQFYRVHTLLTGHPYHRD